MPGAGGWSAEARACARARGTAAFNLAGFGFGSIRRQDAGFCWHGRPNLDPWRYFAMRSLPAQTVKENVQSQPCYKAPFSGAAVEALIK